MIIGNPLRPNPSIFSEQLSIQDCWWVQFFGPGPAPRPVIFHLLDPDPFSDPQNASRVGPGRPGSISNPVSISNLSLAKKLFSEKDTRIYKYNRIKFTFQKLQQY